MNFGDLAYPDVPTDAVHLLPLGATEPHGPHAPLATDTLISIGICRRAAERLEGEIPRARPARRCLTASPATAPPSPARSRSPRRRCARSSPRPRRQLSSAIVLVNSHFEPEQVRDPARRPGTAALRPHAPRHRRAAHGGVPVRLLATRAGTRPRSCSPTVPSSSMSTACAALDPKPRRHAGRDPRRADRASWPWGWSRRTAAPRPRRPPKRVEQTFEVLDRDARRADPRGRSRDHARRPAARAQPRELVRRPQRRGGPRRPRRR